MIDMYQTQWEQEGCLSEDEARMLFRNMEIVRQHGYPVVLGIRFAKYLAQNHKDMVVREFNQDPLGEGWPVVEEVLYDIQKGVDNERIESE